MKTLVLPDGRQLRYELTRKRVKNVNMRLKPDGVVYVSASTRVSEQRVRELLTERADFFFAAMERLKAREEREVLHEKSDSTRLFGKEYPIRVIKSFRERAVFDEDECRVFTQNADEREYVLSLVRQSAAEKFLALCGELDALVRRTLTENGLNPPPTRVTIKDMKSRWGSNSYARGHISINLRLSAYPRETILSVFWHEYAHYWHHDHSKAFYGFVYRFCPKYDEWQRPLKE